VLKFEHLFHALNLYIATLITSHDHRIVIPAKAGIHTDTLDSHFRGNDNTFE